MTLRNGVGCFLGAAPWLVLAGALALQTGAAAQRGELGNSDNLPSDVARSIAACWSPPHEGDEITLRMSFRRDGSVFGKPRITYLKTSGEPDEEAALANSILTAITSCTPLRFTPSLGAAIAGRVFLIRFISPRKEQRV